MIEKDKVDDINSALNWLNETKDTYSFIEVDKHTSKQHIKETIRNVEDILKACKDALDVLEGETI